MVDARAASGLLSRVLGSIDAPPAVVPWLMDAPVPPPSRLRTDPPPPRLDTSLGAIADRVGVPTTSDVSDEFASAYLSLLDRVLEDRKVTDHEVSARSSGAAEWGHKRSLGTQPPRCLSPRVLGSIPRRWRHHRCRGPRSGDPGGIARSLTRRADDGSQASQSRRGSPGQVGLFHGRQRRDDPGPPSPERADQERLAARGRPDRQDQRLEEVRNPRARGSRLTIGASPKWPTISASARSRSRSSGAPSASPSTDRPRRDRTQPRRRAAPSSDGRAPGDRGHSTHYSCAGGTTGAPGVDPKPTGGPLRATYRSREPPVARTRITEIGPRGQPSTAASGKRGVRVDVGRHRDDDQAGIRSQSTQRDPFHQRCHVAPSVPRATTERRSGPHDAAAGTHDGSSDPPSDSHGCQLVPSQ